MQTSGNDLPGSFFQFLFMLRYLLPALSLLVFNVEISNAQKIEHLSLPGFGIARCWPTVRSGTWAKGFNQPLTSYMHSGWNTEAGKQAGLSPVNNPLCGTYETSAGTVWLAFEKLSGNNDGPFWGATNGGLVRIQNQMPILFNKENLPLWAGVEDKGWTAMTGQTGDTALWVGCDKGIRKMKLPSLATTLFPFSQLDTLSHHVDRAASGPKGQVWFWGSEGRVVCAGKQQIQYLDLAPFGMEQKRVADVFLPVWGDTLLLASKGASGDSLLRYSLYRISHHQLADVSAIYGLAHVSFTHLSCEQEQEIIWLSDAENNLYRLQNGVYQKFTQLAHAGNEITDIVCGKDGYKWVCSAKTGLTRWSDFDPKPYSTDTLVGNCNKPIFFADTGKSIHPASLTRTWIWGDGDTSNFLSGTHAYSKAGWYTIYTKTWQSNRIYSDSIQVEVRWIPDMELSTQQDTIRTCQADSVGAYFGKQPITWKTPTGSLAATKILPTEEGFYTAEAAWLGCRQERSFYYQTPNPPSLHIQTDPQEDSGFISAIVPSQVMLHISPDANGFCYSAWVLDANVVGEFSDSIQVIIEDKEVHTITFHYKQSGGCSGQISKTLQVRPFIIPNLITADGNQKNDVFFIPNTAIASLTLFNRWGQEVFSASPYRNDWPDADTTPGTYFYRLEAVGKSYNGWVMVVK